MNNNSLFVALSLLATNPQGCFGFASSSFGMKLSTTTAVYFRPSHSDDDSVELSLAAATTDAAPKKASIMWATGPKADLAAAIIGELCKEDLAGKGDDLFDNDLLDECFI